MFRYGLLIFDVLSIAFFFVVSLGNLPESSLVAALNLIIGLVILLDLAARFWIAFKPMRLFGEIATWADIVVVLSLLLPWFFGNYLFLRVLRALRLLRSYRVIAELRQDFKVFRRNEEVIQSSVTLIVFVFIMTELVYVTQVGNNDKISNHLDALYFTVAALTTTGFGDITLEGSDGRLLSVIILILGVALFLRLVQTIFRPNKVHHVCPDCGLERHESDAVHCKHCGNVIHILNEGEA